MTNVMEIRTADRRVTADRRPSLFRLAGVELRKLGDTRAGFWLLAAIVAVCVVIVVLQLIFTDKAEQNYRQFFLPTLLPTALLLPVLGILSVTSEWSQRSALSTFTLVPARERIMAAKLAAGAIAAVLSVVAGLAFAALANLLSGAIGGDGAWNINAVLIGNALLFQVINVIMGVAFGALLLSSPLAIVLYFLVPTIWSTLGFLVTKLRTAAEWLDLGRTMEPLMNPSLPTAGQWARLGTAVTLWVLLPLVLGVVRVLRSEVK